MCKLNRLPYHEGEGVWLLVFFLCAWVVALRGLGRNSPWKVICFNRTHCLFGLPGSLVWAIPLVSFLGFAINSICEILILKKKNYSDQTIFLLEAPFKCALLVYPRHGWMKLLILSDILQVLFILYWKTIWNVQTALNTPICTSPDVI